MRRSRSPSLSLLEDPELDPASLLPLEELGVPLLEESESEDDDDDEEDPESDDEDVPLLLSLSLLSLLSLDEELELEELEEELEEEEERRRFLLPFFPGPSSANSADFFSSDLLRRSEGISDESKNLFLVCKKSSKKEMLAPGGD